MSGPMRKAGMHAPAPKAKSTRPGPTNPKPKAYSEYMPSDRKYAKKLDRQRAQRDKVDARRMARIKGEVASERAKANQAKKRTTFKSGTRSQS